ncbi:MAG: hypothetical protein ACYS0G_15335 [Planctomycetota bacterium]
MAETDKRIVVEGVEFGQLFRFPNILRAVTMAFQPPRLVLALLLVAALMTVGRIWDGMIDPGVAPGGLTAGSWTAVDEVSAQNALRQAVLDHVEEAQWPDAYAAGEPLGFSAVLALVEAAYRTQRLALQQEAAGATGEARDEARRRLGRADERYSATLENLESHRPRGTFEATVGHVTASFSELIEGLVSLDFRAFFASAGELLVRTPVAIWRQDRIFTVVYGLLFVILIALGGGALSRMTANEVARGERMRLQDAVDFALGSWRRLIFSLLLPLVIAGVLCLVLVGGGWLLMWPWVDVLGGLLYGGALLVGFGVVFLLIGYAVGFSLLLPAVACENCDAADAQQRAYAYVLSRPLHLLGYGIVGLVGLALGFVVASLFAAALLNVTGSLVDAFTANAAVAQTRGFALFDLTPDRGGAIPLQWHSEWSAWLVSFWQTVVVCLVAAYVFAYYFGASTIVYLLMRQASDGQEISEIWQPGFVPGTTTPEPAAGEGAEGTQESEER